MKLSLNETWKRCLKMEKGVIAILEIASEVRDKIKVTTAKRIWLQQNGYRNDIVNDCFFCDYVDNSARGLIENPNIPGGCPTCPGTKIDPDFACQVPEYHWANQPHKFYEKLLELEAKRRRKSRK